MRLNSIVTGLMSAVALAMVVGSPAGASGSGNPFEDIQVGVTYRVYEPAYTAGLTGPRGTFGHPCTDGDEEFLTAQYGSMKATYLELAEGNPICANVNGSGKTVATVTVHAVPANVVAYCEPGNRPQWKHCVRADMARFGGDIMFTLPASSGLRATEVVAITSGIKPVTTAQLIRFARSLTSIPT